MNFQAILILFLYMQEHSTSFPITSYETIINFWKTVDEQSKEKCESSLKVTFLAKLGSKIFENWNFALNFCC